MIQLNLVPLGVNFGGEDNNSYNLGGLMKLSKMPVVYFKCFWSICLSTPRLLEAGYAESMFFVHPRKILKIFSNIYFKFEISFSIKKTDITTTIKTGSCDICLFFSSAKIWGIFCWGWSLWSLWTHVSTNPKTKRVEEINPLMCSYFVLVCIRLIQELAHTYLCTIMFCFQSC